MKKGFIITLFLLLLIIFLPACSSLLPSSQKDIKSPWNEFNDAKLSFDKIVPYKTTSEDLSKLGFDPAETPNIELLNYLDVVQYFMPNQNIKKEELDEGLLGCISARDSCRAYEVKLSKVSTKRFGNVLLDLFGFRRKTKISGWEFKAIIVLNNDLVVYKIWGGKPKIDETTDEKKPLGPLQNSEGILKQLLGF